MEHFGFLLCMFHFKVLLHVNIGLYYPTLGLQ